PQPPPQRHRPPPQPDPPPNPPASPRPARQPPQAPPPREHPAQQGRLVEPPPRAVRHHVPQEGEPPRRSHGTPAPAVDAAALRGLDPRRGVGRRVLRPRRGTALGAQLARLPPPARRARRAARVLPSLRRDGRGLQGALSR